MKNRIAVVGYGGQGAWHCAQLLKGDVAELTGTYDIRKTAMMQLLLTAFLCMILSMLLLMMLRLMRL